MSVADAVKQNLERSSWIRKMFEEGRKLKVQFGETKVFDFSLGNPDLEPPPQFLEALKDAASSAELGTHAYMPNAGYPFARAAMAEKISAEHKLSLSAEDVILTVGAAGALNVVLKTILNPGDDVIVLRPYFAEYAFYIDNQRGTMVPVETGADFLPDMDKIRQVLSAKTAAIILNTPNNPSGRVYPRTVIEDLAKLLKAHGQGCGRLPVLIVDEPYRDIVYDGIVAAPILDAYEESIVVSSFSKTLSVPGERIGYIGLNPAISEHKLLLDGMIMANRILGYVNAPALMQRAVTSSWRARADIDRYRRRRDMLVRVMDAAGLEYAKPEGAFYLFVKVPAGSKVVPAGSSADVEFAMHLKSHKILGVPGIGFGCPGWLRFSYCVPESVIEQSQTAFKEAVAAW
ncbi:MAG: pyridoxal phosphate-dependent aminotransferase [Spirochaetes bacterium]|nr:pyridoxal phosphate-dependent aminotransferase [Spirochaetota bacterium]MBU0955213.1 pyridoxal phosphate-dependent aminotransferase [Spirochaetota bacterium]